MKKKIKKTNKVIASKPVTKKKKQKVISSKPVTGKKKEPLAWPSHFGANWNLQGPPKPVVNTSSLPEYRIKVISDTRYGKIELLYNKVTKQTHWRTRGINGEILAWCEPMKNKKDVLNNLSLNTNILMFA